MNLDVNFGLPFVSVTVYFRGLKLVLEKVLLETGSAGTIFNADVVGRIEVGSMDYGMKIDGIIGFDFIKMAGLVIDVENMQVYSGKESCRNNIR